MRIIIYTHEFIPFTGGIATYCYELACGLCLRGHQVVVVTPKFERVDREDLPFKIEWFKADARTNKRTMIVLMLRAIKRLRRVVRQFNPDVLLVTDPRALIAATVLRYLVRTKLVPIIHGSEVLHEKDRKRGLLSWQMQRFCTSRRLIICASVYTRTLFLSTYPVPPENVVVVHNGMRNRFNEKIHCGYSVREQWNISSTVTVLLTFARLHPRKGQDVIIRALRNIIERHPNVMYLCAGTGPYRDTLSRLAIDYEVEDYVVFPGQVPEDEKYAYYDACDLFVMPSRREGNSVEGFGLSFLEAWHASKPVLGGNHGGVVEVIDDSVDGVIVDPEDVDAVADAVVSLVRDPSRLKEMGRRGNAKARWEFTEVRMADQTVRALGDA